MVEKGYTLNRLNVFSRLTLIVYMKLRMNVNGTGHCQRASTLEWHLCQFNSLWPGGLPSKMFCDIHLRVISCDVLTK